MILSLLLYFVLLSIAAFFCGKYVYLVFKPEGRFDSIASYVVSVSAFESQTWKQYLSSIMIFNIVCFIGTFLVIYYQNYLPMNYTDVGQMGLSQALNAAVSFVTNTFWQSHNPETELTYLSKIVALIGQEFIAPCTGFATFLAFCRGITNLRNPLLGNFYLDAIKAFVFILLPGATILAILLLCAGVPENIDQLVYYQNFLGDVERFFIGPAASQTAIKIFASNGGSIFAESSSHPFETPNQIAILIQMFAILLLPLSLIFTYGFMVNNKRQSWLLYGVVIFLLLLGTLGLYSSEGSAFEKIFKGNVKWLDSFNFTGKEILHDKFISVLWSVAISISSTGSPNVDIEGMSPISILFMLANLVVGKFILDGVGSGFFTLLMYMIIAVFIKGLITGHNPTFMGKKISLREINYTSILMLIYPVGVLLFTGITLLLSDYHGAADSYPPRAITEVTYAFASAFSNNGSSMNGLELSNHYINIMTALGMIVGRYPTIYVCLALAGSLASKGRIIKVQEVGSNILFGVFLILMIIFTGLLTFFPLLMLGPFLEAMRLT